MKQIQDTIQTLNGIQARGIFSFVAVTTKDALKKSRVTKEPTPSRLQTVTVYRACVVSLGNDYEAVVNSRLEKEGKEADFVSKGSYCAPVAPNCLVFKHNEKDSYYLRVYPNLCHSVKSVVRYFGADGVEISAEDFKKFEKEYFALKGCNDSQGLDDAILVNNYKLENVKYLKRGDIHLDQLTSEIINITKGA